MSQSLSLIVVHLIFSTKNREPLLKPEIPIHAYLATVARNAGCDCYRVGGIADHVHIALRLSRTVTVAKLVEELKTSSSKWLKTQSIPNFAWQSGYGAFSVGPSDLDALTRYIDSQPEHHRKVSYQDEYRAFLAKYNIEFDERFIWS